MFSKSMVKMSYLNQNELMICPHFVKNLIYLFDNIFCSFPFGIVGTDKRI